MTRKIERDLDKVLSGETHPVDEDQAAVAEMAAELEAAFSVEAPPATRERSMFVHALAGRGTSRAPSLRFAIPATALMLLLALTAFFGRTATGGDLLFPVRKAMAEAGLATNPEEEIDRHLEAAEEFIDRAEEAGESDLSEAEQLVYRASGRLAQARTAADQLGADERRDAREEIRDVEQEGSEVLAEIVEEQRKESEDGGGDSSGSGSDDSSGPGSGDDSSGSGSGDDSSGSGSGSGDDSSGSGSGSDDSSGSGSGDSSGSGSGSGDSSGSGSGDDSSGSG